MLGESAGINPVYDSELKGRIKATRALIEIAYEDIYGETDNGD